jgi:hypothetical protein
MTHPHPLRYDQPTEIDARGDGKVLLASLGAMGIGRMWVTDTDYKHRKDYLAAPYSPEMQDDFGETGS